MKLRFIFGTLLVVSAAHSSLAQQGANYYVSPSGDNKNQGISPAQPFKTITKALNIASAGATIHVRGGLQNTYYDQIKPIRSGRPDAYISLVNYGEGPAYISGAVGGYEALLQLSNVHYIRISGFHFHTNHRSGAKGIYINGSSSNIQVDNCEVYNIGWQKAMDIRPTDKAKHNAHGILVKGTSVIPTSTISITNSIIRDINPGFSEGVTVTGNTENFFLSNLRVHNVTNIGIDIAGHWPNEASVPINQNYARKGTVRGCTVFDCKVFLGMDVNAGIYVDGASDIIIEGNRSYRNGVGFSIGCENSNKAAQNIRLRNNIATDNDRVGLALGSSNRSSTIQNCRITNNTFAQNCRRKQNTEWGTEVTLYNSNGVVFKQNILYPIDFKSHAIGTWNNYSITNFSSSYNLYWRANGNLSDMFPNVTEGLPAIKGDPKFINITLPNSNYHLLQGSKAINAGDPNFAVGDVNERDIDNEERIRQGRADIGADESSYWGFENISEREDVKEDTEGTLKYLIAPNPVVDVLNITFTKPYSGEIILIDSSGKMVRQTNVEGAVEVLIDVQNLSKGIYFLIVKDQTIKIIK